MSDEQPVEKKMEMIRIAIKYYVVDNNFEVETNTTHPSDLVIEYIRSQIGAGEDTSPANRKSKYEIVIYLDLSDDSFKVVHDCGNEGLMLGILMEYIKYVKRIEG